MCARRFLVAVFILTLLVVAGAFAIFQFGGQVLKRQMTPQGHYRAPPAHSGPDYRSVTSWAARPGIGNDPSAWQPEGLPPVFERGPAAIFYIHPTTYLERDRWNAPVDEPRSRERAELFVRSQASAFAASGDVWAPRYRQAAFGAFLLDNDDARKALALAYSDVARAFDEFLRQVPNGKPLILAGHSQGALHLSRLLREYAPQLRERLIAAYIVGWPLSLTADLPAIGFPACRRPDEAGCVLSWQSFAEPANPDLILDAWEGTAGPGGLKRKRKDMACVNPITGTVNGAAPPAANAGTLVPNGDLTNATLAKGQVGARCERGFLLIDGEIPEMGPYVLPGNNYHVYDYALFWAAVCQDSQRRLRAWQR